MKQYHYYTGEDFTIVICAYGNCEYLEKCIQSVKRQTVKAKVLISTSTPNDHIRGLAEKYGIEMRVNPEGGHVKDYNFAMRQADTPLCMLAHQDDLISKRFVEMNLKALNHTKRPVIAFCNYLEMHDDVVDQKPSAMVKVKRLMLSPLKIPGLGGTQFGKWLIQCMGDPITHPTVVCVMKEMPEEIFREKYRASMDWDLWQRLSKQEGAFVYTSRVMLLHRMNKENATAQLFEHTNARYEEEFEIMNRFWPKWVVKIIMHFYSKTAQFY